MGIDKEKILGLAQKYVLKGQSKKATKELEKLVESSPEDSRLRLKLGDLYLKNSDNESAIKEYLKVAELYETEDLNLKAVSIYKKVLSINPNYIEALQKMAGLYIKEGLEGSAKNCFQTILKIRPDDSEALSALELIDHRRQSVVAPQNGQVDQFNPAKSASAPKRPKAAEQSGGHRSLVPGNANAPSSPAQTEGLSSPTKDAEMHYHLGIAYKEMELFDYAISEFEAASDDISIGFDCYIMLGDCYMERGDYDKSIESYKKASQITGLSNERLARLHFNLGLAYEASGMVSEALDTFKLVLDLDQSLLDAQEKIQKLQSLPK